MLQGCNNVNVEYCVKASSPFLVKNTKCLEQVLNKAPRMVEGSKQVGLQTKIEHNRNAKSACVVSTHSVLCQRFYALCCH
jgi:hypothetical protein